MKHRISSFLRYAPLIALTAAGCGDERGSDLDRAQPGAAECRTLTTLAGATVNATALPPNYITTSGQVRTATRTFASLSEWYASSQFRQVPLCRAYEGPRRRLPITSKPDQHIAPLASPDHCTLAFTDIEDEYHLEDTSLVIPVVFHNIVRTDGVGFVSDAQFLAQIDVLNEDFGMLEGTPGDGGPLSNDTHIRFVLAGIHRVEDDDWFDFPAAYEGQYKSLLSWDPSEYLNIYTAGISDDDQSTLAWAYYPQGAAGEDDTDGIVTFYDVVGRDGDHAPYDQGRVMTHEVGHYLGLLHTFDPNDGDGVSGVCENDWDSGDLIQDTPEEDEPTFDCPNRAQTCGYDLPSTGGNVHNYMNYTDDACKFYFTIQQANRAVCGLVNYRADLYRTIPATYDVHNYIKPASGGAIHLPKAPIPAGTQIVLSALPNIPANQAAPTWNAHLRLRRKLVGETEWTLVAEDISSGLTHASITHNVTDKASYQWSVGREGGGIPGPYTLNATYLNCWDPSSSDNIKDIPACEN
jgi:hypothetical protein